jgi:VWFA-related protein
MVMQATGSKRRTKVSLAVAIVASVVALSAQAPSDKPTAPPQSQKPQQQETAQQQQPQQPTVIRRAFDIITTDVIVRDNKGQFIADLKKDDFELYEDGVKQDIQSFILTHGGRVYNVAAPPPPAQLEGIILPPSRPTNDAAGRIWMIFVDDLHLDFKNTGRIKDLFKRIAKELVHEGDMFGIVSTGPSSLAIDLTYDHKRLDEAIDKISGAGLKPNEILDAPVGAEGPSEVRYRAHVAFGTAYDVLKQLEQVHNRRKAFVYVSNGYDFDPFAETRKQNAIQKAKDTFGAGDDGNGNPSNYDTPDTNPFLSQGNEFSFADLASEISELTREANRANATIYTIDPRGLVGMPDLDEKVDMMDYQNYVTTSQNSLRVISEQTGGFATINQNDFTKALKRIDAETSDYYVLGYYTSNPDPLKRRRRVEVKVNRPNIEVRYRTEYTLKPTKAPPAKTNSPAPVPVKKKPGGK